MDNKMMGMSFNRFKTCSALFAIAFTVLVIITLTYQNSMFYLSEGFSKDKILRRRPHNVTTMDLGFRESAKNTSDMNGTSSESRFPQEELSTTATEDGAQNLTGSDEGFKKASISHIKSNGTEQLYEGLLASGFDKSSCISRFQSYLYRYRKASSPHKPSSYLISKLRNYEEIHRKCGPGTRHYNGTMKKLARFKKQSTNTTCKYLVWTPANGLGNRIISMAAAFVYALLTDRVLLVKFEDDMMGLFCEPFLNSTWLFPKDSPFWNPRGVETYQSMLAKNSSPSVLHLNLQHSKEDPEKFFHCDHSQKLVRKVPFLILLTDQYFVPSLFMIPSFNLEMTQMFPERDTVFHHVGHYLFHPSNEAWGLISRFYDAYLAKSDEKIGLQIRLFSPHSTPHEAVMDLLLSCTLQHKLLPELDTKNSVDSTQENSSLKAVLVASLFPEYGENLKTMYLRKPTITGELVGVYQPSHEGHQKFHNNMHNMKAWTEMYLLSLCDKLVTTSLSTFGYVAQGLGGLKPWLLYRLVGNRTLHPNPPCQRDFSMEPCYHIPPKHDCEGNSIKHFTSSFPYMRSCVDYSSGVKLVNVSI
ncbi:fucosyltransferase 2-like isoform X1 [Neltuma alba]|uniref:fucosyltransferase 2-like isoform X1 n=1 Tax=Neltuma alba TaxID=207710 RepID=UPI0010A51448|nr:fucosyltransferase 2-like isoform X1 [Prosopis alba]XP_028781030.1 fucosyltransferase 2-like isoform X1 [Prosopis alba]XP_028781031.1 fucosyltransferase 2-like isoform X1 [Prosopis alba]